jgi:hypothetical protein
LIISNGWLTDEPLIGDIKIGEEDFPFPGERVISPAGNSFFTTLE